LSPRISLLDSAEAAGAKDQSALVDAGELKIAAAMHGTTTGKELWPL
jgi:hypothetical protein